MGFRGISTLLLSAWMGLTSLVITPPQPPLPGAGDLGTTYAHLDATALLIGKNYDDIPLQGQALRMVKPEGKISYLVWEGQAEKSQAGVEPSINGGINQKGLVVFYSAAPLGTNNNHSAIVARLLENCDSVACVQEKATDLFQEAGTAFLILGDAHKIAQVEIAPDGKYTITAKEKGSLYHTNHYLTEDYEKYNQGVSESSLKRYARIQSIMEDKKARFSADALRKISFDHSDGPNNSLYRTGTLCNPLRTIGHLTFEVKKNQPPRLYGWLRDMLADNRKLDIKLNDAFWQKPEGVVSPASKPFQCGKETANQTRLALTDDATIRYGDTKGVQYCLNNYAADQRYDLYLWIKFAGTDTLRYLKLKGENSQTALYELSPVPYCKDVPVLDQEGIVMLPQFVVGMPTGEYTIFAVPVLAGNDVKNSANWVGDLQKVKFSLLSSDAPPSGLE